MMEPRSKGNRRLLTLSGFQFILPRNEGRMMKNLILTAGFVFGACFVQAEPGKPAPKASPRRAPANASSMSDEAKIRKLFSDATDAWNRGDIDAFMASYSHSDDTLFVGDSGV